MVTASYGPYDPANGHRCDPSKLLLDPYAKAISGTVKNDPSLFSYDFTDPTQRNEEDSADYTMRSSGWLAPSSTGAATARRLTPITKP